jgi:hypothetical protein
MFIQATLFFGAIPAKDNPTPGTLANLFPPKNGGAPVQNGVRNIVVELV